MIDGGVFRCLPSNLETATAGNRCRWNQCAPFVGGLIAECPCESGRATCSITLFDNRDSHFAALYQLLAFKRYRAKPQAKTLLSYRLDGVIE
jgi:hypothetical protein